MEVLFNVELGRMEQEAFRMQPPKLQFILFSQVK